MMGGKSGGSTVGYKYYMGLHMGLCRGPVNSLVEIQVGERKAWPLPGVAVTGGGTTTTIVGTGADTTIETTFNPFVYTPTAAPDPITASGTISIDAPDLFGGDNKEGGIQGPCNVMMGEATQGQNAGLIAMLGDALIGAFRGVVTLFFDGEIAAMNPYPKPWRFRVRRQTAGWEGEVFQPGLAKIILHVTVAGVSQEIHAMNPAHIIYECLTNSQWGRGMPRELIDADSFSSAASCLLAEAFGLCMPWSRQDTIEAFVQKVIDHIGAVIYASRETGLITLKLVRDCADSLTTFTTDDAILEVEEDEENSPTALINEIIVTFKDALTGQSAQTRVQNIGVMQAVGAINSKTADYPGLPTLALANRIAQRDMLIHSSNLRRFTFKMNRQAWKLVPGDVFIFSDTKRGIGGMVVRVGKVEDDQDSSIRVTVIQDVFKLPNTSFVTAPPAVSTPTTQPSVATFSAIYEASYRDLVRRMTSADFAALTGTETFVYLMGAKPSIGFSLNYGVYTGTPTTEPTLKGAGDWAPAGVLTSMLAPDQTTLFVAIGSLPDTITIGSAGMVEDEVVRIDAFDSATGAVTIARGCVDTIPQSHTADVAFWVADAGFGPDPTRYTQSEEVLGKVLTNTSAGQLHPSLATELSITTAARHPRPYPPAKVQINGIHFAIASVVQPDPVLTWVHRNRVTQSDVLVHQMNGSVTPETGTTYTVQVRLQSDNSLVREVTGLTGMTWTYSAANWATDGSPELVYFDLFSVRDGWNSWQRYHIPVRIKNAGWGLNWGSNWGGI